MNPVRYLRTLPAQFRAARGIAESLADVEFLACGCGGANPGCSGYFARFPDGEVTSLTPAAYHRLRRMQARALAHP